MRASARSRRSISPAASRATSSASRAACPTSTARSRRIDVSDRERPQLQKLEGQLNDQLDRAATSSFERSFLFAALLAGLAARYRSRSRGRCRCEAARCRAPPCWPARRRSRSPCPAAYLALGGGSYEPSYVRNPCAERIWRDPGSVRPSRSRSRSRRSTARPATSASRARRSRSRSRPPARASGSRARITSTTTSSRTPCAAASSARVDDAESAGAISGWRAAALRVGAEHIPVEQMADLVDVLRALVDKAGGIPNIDIRTSSARRSADLHEWGLTPCRPQPQRRSSVAGRRNAKPVGSGAWTSSSPGSRSKSAVDGRLALHAPEVEAEAVVLAVAQREVVARVGAPDVEALGVGEHGRDRDWPRRCSRRGTRPRRASTPPSSQRAAPSSAR